MDIVCCPTCGQPSEVMWRRYLASSDGPVEHTSLRCLARHVMLMPTKDLTPTSSGLDTAQRRFYTFGCPSLVPLPTQRHPVL